MEVFIKKIERDGKRYRIAFHVFIGAIVLLYAANFVIHAFAYQESAGDLLKDILLPLVVTAIVSVIDWKHNYSISLVFNHFPKVKMVALCAPMVAIFLSFLSYDPHSDTIDFNITFFAMTSMCIAPYALRDVQRSCIAIVCQTVAFVIVAAKLGNNTAAIVTICAIACTLICCLPKLSCFDHLEEYAYAKSKVALVMLFAAMMIVLFVQETGVIYAFCTSAMGRPGMGSSAFVNQQCTEVLRTAKIVGSVLREYCLDTVFSHRVLTFVLAKAGWLAVMPLILALTLMITSGIYLCHRNITTQYYISISFLALIVVQAIGYILMCSGVDKCLFPQICPFLDGGFVENTLFLLMGIFIPLPERLKLSNSFWPDVEGEDIDFEEWLSSSLDSDAD